MREKIKYICVGIIICWVIRWALRGVDELLVYRIDDITLFIQLILCALGVYYFIKMRKNDNEESKKF